jgi:chromate transporter
VLGGGHVVLPLLQDLVNEGLIPASDFFAGYGAVQAMPGPVFTFAAFIGAANTSSLNGIFGAIVATVAIFVPSFALIFALAAYALIAVWKFPPWTVVVASALLGAAVGALR